MKEEVELAEAAPFKTLDQAVAHATDKVKTHRDNLDGIEVYKGLGGDLTETRYFTDDADPVDNKEGALNGSPMSFCPLNEKMEAPGKNF